MRPCAGSVLRSVVPNACGAVRGVQNSNTSIETTSAVFIFIFLLNNIYASTERQIVSILSDMRRLRCSSAVLEHYVVKCSTYNTMLDNIITTELN